jgi:hypothetical protein
MVTPFTKYKCRNGAEFASEEAARKYEILLDEVDAAMAPLGRHPDTCDFANGGGYLQHAPGAVFKAFDAIVALVERTLASLPEGWQPLPSAEIWRCRGGIIGRYLDDSHSVLWRAWVRFLCVDDRFREWGQPYHARNGDARKEFCLEDRG